MELPQNPHFQDAILMGYAEIEFYHQIQKLQVPHRIYCVHQTFKVEHISSPQIQQPN
jgi:hypothetical protein